MLAELEALRLVVRADALAVHSVGAGQHLLVDEAADDLAVLEDERHFARAHFENGARSQPARTGIAEAGIEEARVMHAKFADERIERHHLGGVIRGYLHRFLGCEDVEFAGIEDQAAIGTRRDRLPEIIDRIAGATIDIDHAGVTLGAIADEAAASFTGEING